MAIDTKSITDVITEFRALQAKDAVSPESLGAILQRIVDLLSTAGTSETVNKITQLLDGFKAAGQAITALSQGTSDRNHIYMNKSTVNLATGATSTSDVLFIQQATTERAGAMRAQQVTDLNAAKKGVTELQNQMTSVNSLISQLQSAITGSADGVLVGNIQQIAVGAEDNVLRVVGATPLINAGCVPYIFRLTKKRNQYHERMRTDADRDRRYCAKRKGWNLWGSRLAVRVDNGIVAFSINGKDDLTKEAVGWSTTPTTLIREHTDRDGKKSVGWGRTRLSLHDDFDGAYRLVRLRFAIAFGKPLGPGKVRVTQANMSSNLAEFSVIFDPKSKTWSFSK